MIEERCIVQIKKIYHNLSKISTILAERGISIFAVSTYNTDYILIKDTNYEKALEVLKSSGYEIVE